MPDTFESQLSKSTTVIQPRLTEFFAYIKKLFGHKPNALELFLTLSAIEISAKQNKEALWDQMTGNLPNSFQKKHKQQLKAEIMTVAEKLAMDPSIRLDGEKKANSKIWTPQKKGIL